MTNHKERGIKALRAAKSFGLAKEDVKPVLLQLLKSVDNNWDCIEAEDYQLLKETYFEVMEAKLAANLKSGPVERIDLLEDQAVADIAISGLRDTPMSSVAELATPSTISGRRDAPNSSIAEARVESLQKSSHRPYIRDITKGTENVTISLVDEYGGEELPKFSYIRSNIVYQKACLQISLARISDADCCSSCIGDCLAQEIPCTCASETGGEFAYTKQGLLNEKFLEACISMKVNPQNHHLVFCQDCPLERVKNEKAPARCTGHLIRKFIKECWVKCGCDMSCGNRVVQRGITCKLQVFVTREGKGWGLRALQDLPKGAFVCEYAGEILTNTELYERNLTSGGRGRHTYPVTLDADWGSEKILKDDEALCLDATNCGNVARFINHRCNDANLMNIPVEVETPDRHFYHLGLFTAREVKAQEELTWDYGIDFNDHDHPIKAFKCLCGSQCCRDKKPKRPELVRFCPDKKPKREVVEREVLELDDDSD